MYGPDKCGQTSRSVAGVKIPTGCYVVTRSIICDNFVHCDSHFFLDLFVGQAILLFMGLWMDFHVFKYFDVLLLKNLPDPSSSSSANSRSSSWKQSWYIGAKYCEV